MTTLTPAKPIVKAQVMIAALLHRVDDALDRVAELVVRDVLQLEVVDQPAAPAPSAAYAEQDVQTAGRSEYDDLISEYRLQIGYHRDTNWAVPEMWVEMAAGGIGAGTFLASALTGSVPGMVAGFVLTAAVKGTLLLFDLGRPERVWRVFSKPGTSWISRGSWAFAAFAGAGGIVTAASLAGVSGALLTPLVALASLAAIVLLVYDGFFLNASAGVAGWRSSVLPFFFAANGAATGAALTAALMANPPAALGWIAAGLFATAAALGFGYLSDLRHGLKSSRVTEHELTKGDQAVDFMVGAGLVGAVIPAGLAALAATGVLPIAMVKAAALGAVGVYFSRKAVLKAGVHAPVL